MAQMAVTRVTHSCHLIEIGGRMFLTDPWFSTKPGYYQGEPIAVGIPDLPHLDGVLISHAHHDHSDLDAFAAFRDKGVPMHHDNPRSTWRPQPTATGRPAGWTTTC
jgi:L-ascorbate metabolism protein UlaG (beta-lactamase superfamily)